MKILAENRRAFNDYQILEKIEAGLVLTGQEVKSIKAGRMNLIGSYVVLKDQEPYLIGAKVPPWQPANSPEDYNPQQSRKLLLHKSEIKRLIGKSRERGLTLIPLKVYTKNARIKLEFGIAKGKRKIDKRETIKRREAEREMKRALKRG